jgi:opacity protein-like surface antigen
MKKMKLFFLLLSIVLYTQSYAQETFKSKEDKFKEPLFQKGDKMIGTSIGLGLGSSGAYAYSVKPQLGYFLRDGLMIGASFSHLHQKAGDYFKYNNYSPEIFARHYVLRGEKLSLFTQMGVNYSFYNRYINNYGNSSEGTFQSGNSLNLSVGAGVNYRISNHLSLELQVKKNIMNYSNKTYNLGGIASPIPLMPSLSLIYTF